MNQSRVDHTGQRERNRVGMNTDRILGKTKFPAGFVRLQQVLTQAKTLTSSSILTPKHFSHPRQSRNTSNQASPSPEHHLRPKTNYGRPIFGEAATPNKTQLKLTKCNTKSSVRLNQSITINTVYKQLVERRQNE